MFTRIYKVARLAYRNFQLSVLACVLTWCESSARQRNDSFSPAIFVRFPIDEGKHIQTSHSRKEVMSMTTNSVNLYKARKEHTDRQASLAEQERSNRERERETHRANTALERETYRSNVANQAIQNRKITVDEVIAKLNRENQAEIAALNRILEREKLAETRTANRNREAIESDKLAETTTANRNKEANDAKAILQRLVSSFESDWVKAGLGAAMYDDELGDKLTEYRDVLKDSLHKIFQDTRITGDIDDVISKLSPVEKVKKDIDKMRKNYDPKTNTFIPITASRDEAGEQAALEEAAIHHGYLMPLKKGTIINGKWKENK